MIDTIIGIGTVVDETINVLPEDLVGDWISQLIENGLNLQFEGPTYSPERFLPDLVKLDLINMQVIVYYF